MVLFMILLSILAMNSGVLGARLLKNEMKMEDLAKPPVSVNGERGFFATINRAVPSCPDPLHNR